MSTSVTVLIFTLTYALIASRRLRLLPVGRPAGALIGAVLMVATGALTPAQSFAAIDHSTLALLLGMMILSVYLERSGLLTRGIAMTLSRAKSGMGITLATAWIAAILSAFLVNDTVCLFLTPALVALCHRRNVAMGPPLIALATSANIGSAATLVGNPQNMLIGTMSDIPFATFLGICGPATLAAMVVNSLLLWLMYRRVWRDEATRAVEPDTAHEALAPDATRTLIITLAVVGAFFAGAHLGYAALAGAAALMILDRREPHEVFAKVEWTLLLFFSALFIVVAGLEHTGLIAQAWQALAPKFQLDQGAGVLWFSAALVVGSNLISNVPMVLMTGPHLDALGSSTRGWALLAFVATIAGNLTLVGSVANLIVAERARERYDLGFWEYLRFGVISTLGALLVGVPLILWMT